MLPKTRFKIRFIIQISIAGMIAGVIYAYLMHLLEEFELVPILLRGFFTGLFVGISIGIIEKIEILKDWKRKPFIFLLIYRATLYSFSIILWLTLINALSPLITSNIPLNRGILNYIYSDYFLRDFLFAFIMSSFIVAVMQICKLLRRGDLIRFVAGQYHQPKEVKRIFLFVDLKSSTTIAERLGNLKYSSFLKDFFFDLTEAILISKGDIYQYVGDEIIISWPYATGIENARCIHCFYDMKNSIELKKEKYLIKYSVMPEFKAGLHGGKMVVTWIGEIKKEIVYHGDVLNTAARIQAECNNFKQDLLISEGLLNDIDLPPYLKVEYLDELNLKGKSKRVRVCALNWVGI